MLTQQSRRTDAGQHQQFRRGQRASGDDDFAAGDELRAPPEGPAAMVMEMLQDIVTQFYCPLDPNPEAEFEHINPIIDIAGPDWGPYEITLYPFTHDKMKDNTGVEKEITVWHDIAAVVITMQYVSDSLARVILLEVVYVSCKDFVRILNSV